MSEIKDQPAPTHRPDVPATWELVIQDVLQMFQVGTDRPRTREFADVVKDAVVEDMLARDAVGRERYGTPLQPHNGRDSLVDAYQEALDCAVYLRNDMEENPDDPLVETLYQSTLVNLCRLRSRIEFRRNPPIVGTPEVVR